MCGFTGFIDPAGLDANALETVREMAKCIVHRGPDDAGSWVDHQAGVALGFQRLSIIDLSAAGHQPMDSASGRYVIVFNGEIYNHAELRSELSGNGAQWRGHSDTETLLAAVERWGIEQALSRTVGMFAFALWDRQERALILARDRMGEKPCYYGWQGGSFLFASELKALTSHPRFSPTVDRSAVALYLRYGYVPAPHSIYQDVKKLRPGTFLRLDLAKGVDRLRDEEPRPYWTLREAVQRGLADPFTGSDEEAVDGLEAVLSRSVALQRVADVPLGAFLSGGIDSSTITALMQAQSDRPVRTFTIGFEEAGYDESGYAKAIAEHLGTDHTELRVTPAEAMAVIDELPTLYDEPFGDASAIPTYLVSALARRHVTVALSGDGGDELFAGYHRYHHAHRTWSRVRGLPQPLRATAGLAAEGLLAVSTVLPPRHAGSGALLGQRLQFLKAATHPSITRLYREHMSLWKRPERVVAGKLVEPKSILTDEQALLGIDGFERMMYVDAKSYLPDDVLAKVDRAAMAVSLETRVPLLDHRVVEYAWRLPMRFKVRGIEGKWVLKRLLERYVPRSLIDRPKMGFGVPIDHWIRGPLRSWAEDLLDERRLQQQGFFDPAPIRARWSEHLSGKRDWQYLLWPVLVFQAWLGSRRS